MIAIIPILSYPTLFDFFSPFRSFSSLPSLITLFFLQPYSIPHPQKVEKGGEDAYFVSTDGKAIGVADGTSISFLFLCFDIVAGS